MVDHWRSATCFEGGIEISIDKKIPIQAGLGEVVLMWYLPDRIKPLFAEET